MKSVEFSFASPHSKTIAGTIILAFALHLPTCAAGPRYDAESTSLCGLACVF